jgi:homoserine dehydrogenase
VLQQLYCHCGIAVVQVVGQAKEQGYTEPDPREDLSGALCMICLTIGSSFAFVTVSKMVTGVLRAWQGFLIHCAHGGSCMRFTKHGQTVQLCTAEVNARGLPALLGMQNTSKQLV